MTYNTKVAIYVGVALFLIGLVVPAGLFCTYLFIIVKEYLR